MRCQIAHKRAKYHAISMGKRPEQILSWQFVGKSQGVLSCWLQFHRFSAAYCDPSSYQPTTWPKAFSSQTMLWFATRLSVLWSKARSIALTSQATNKIWMSDPSEFVSHRITISYQRKLEMISKQYLEVSYLVLHCIIDYNCI